MIRKPFSRCVKAQRSFLSTIPIDKMSLPAERYLDPKYYEYERNHLLGNTWQLLTHESLLIQDKPSPATYIAEDVCGWPIIVVRNSETGVLNGYLNICRHRAGPLEANGTVGACSIKGLTCKYHAWTWSLDGKLKGVPRFGELEGMRKEDFPLWPIRVARWRGFLFVKILPQPFNFSSTSPCSATSPPSTPSPQLRHSQEENDQDFLQNNEDFVSRLSGYPLEDYSLHTLRTHKLSCNWKLYVENYLEGYHIPSVHAGLNQQIDMNSYYVKTSPSYVEHIVSSPDTCSPTPYAGIWAWLRPCLALNFYDGGLNMERIVPTSPSTTEIRYQFLFKKDNEKQKNDFALDTSKEVTLEDIDIVSTVQRNMESGGYLRPGPLSPRHEEGVRMFHRLVREAHERGEREGGDRREDGR